MLAVIGCGNLNRSDDGVGARVARRLAERLARHPVPGVRAFDCGTAGMEVMFAARGADALLVLDASRTGSPPGTIYDVPGEELAHDHEPSLSLHDFRWDHALAAGRRIFRGDFPAEVRVWLVESRELGLGLELSSEVAAAAEVLYQRVLRYVAEYATRRHVGEQPAPVTLRRGSIHLGVDVYRRYFDGREAAVVFARDGELCVMPVEAMAGGVLVKQRNAAGDRSVDAAEVVRQHGWDDAGEHALSGRWDVELGAIAIAMPAASGLAPHRSEA